MFSAPTILNFMLKGESFNTNLAVPLSAIIFKFDGALNIDWTVSRFIKNIWLKSVGKSEKKSRQNRDQNCRLIRP